MSLTGFSVRILEVGLNGALLHVFLNIQIGPKGGRADSNPYAAAGFPTHQSNNEQAIHNYFYYY